MNSLLVAHNSTVPFWKVFLATQVTTHSVCSIVEFSVEFLNRRKFGPFFTGAFLVVASAVASVLGVAAGGIIHVLLLVGEGVERPHGGSYNILLSSLILALFISFLEKSMQILIERRRKTESELKEIQYRTFQNRMDPHYLFNTLNTVHSLLVTDPQKADHALILLSETYRFLSDRIFEKTIPFAEEWNFTVNYLELQRIRFSDSLTIRIQKSGDFSRLRIPPLTLQPLVENSFKHGLENRSESGILEISAIEDDGRIRIEIRNNGNDKSENGFLPEKKKSEFTRTLDNIKSRLEYNFGNADLILEKNKLGITVLKLEFATR
ncbi:sensor histidine kinase [Leptospira semungkisensis]|uniref:Sensor histidine kinase n=1 Tax=Leptospira semungkisensis TaxID=2484985 RepID=A0A4R9G1I8_9LEPT|nr:histidine kinase [Leptospira semungkisensis]TGK05083.1 sensor histidine kinase [Leptospira semungkisensis]